MERIDLAGGKREMNTDEAIAIIRKCPQCRNDNTYLFHHVSDPATKDDGTYAVCADCNVFWRLTIDWQHPEIIAKDFATAIEISNTIRAHCRRIEPSPALSELAEKLRSPSADRGTHDHDHDD
jgi:hypothetical protein